MEAAAPSYLFEFIGSSAWLRACTLLYKLTFLARWLSRAFYYFVLLRSNGRKFVALLSVSLLLDGCMLVWKRSALSHAEMLYFWFSKGSSYYSSISSISNTFFSLNFDLDGLSSRSTQEELTFFGMILLSMLWLTMMSSYSSSPALEIYSSRSINLSLLSISCSRFWFIFKFLGSFLIFLFPRSIPFVFYCFILKKFYYFWLEMSDRMKLVPITSNPSMAANINCRSFSKLWKENSLMAM